MDAHETFPYTDFLTQMPNCSHRSVSWSAPRRQVKLCVNPKFASFNSLFWEMPITSVFSLAKASPNAKNFLASLIQLFVSARTKIIRPLFRQFVRLVKLTVICLN